MDRVDYANGATRLATAFMCSICKCSNFKDVVVPKDQGYYRTAFFECCECSVMFHDPVKFSVDLWRTDAAKLSKADCRERVLAV